MYKIGGPGTVEILGAPENNEGSMTDAQTAKQNQHNNTHVH